MFMFTQARNSEISLGIYKGNTAFGYKRQLIEIL